MTVSYPEPWRVSSGGTYEADVVAANGAPVFRAEDMDLPDQAACVNRIVRCVNACAGLTDAQVDALPALVRTAERYVAAENGTAITMRDAVHFGLVFEKLLAGDALYAVAYANVGKEEESRDSTG